MAIDTTPAFIRRYTQRIGTYQGIPQQPDNQQSNYSLNNDYALGSRTYGGSSPSPHAGAGGVDPAGYAERDSQAMTRKRLLIKMVGGK
jgi:hypothetical protein